MRAETARQTEGVPANLNTAGTRGNELQREYAALRASLADALQNAMKQGIRFIDAALAGIRGKAPSTDPDVAVRLAPERQKTFIAQYNIRAIEGQDSQVAVKIPSDVSYAEFLQESQDLSIALHRANPSKYRALQAISPQQLQEWLAATTFKEKGSGIEIVTDGCVPGSSGQGMTRDGQEALLTRMNLTMEKIRELALAHIARYILDGRSIFQGQTVRGVGGALFFNGDGLIKNVVYVGYSSDDVSSSARLSPSESKI